MAKRVALKDYVDLLGGYIGVWKGEYKPSNTSVIELTHYKTYGEIPTTGHSAYAGFSILTLHDPDRKLLIGGTLISGACTTFGEIFTGVTIHGTSNAELTYNNNFCVAGHILPSSSGMPEIVRITKLAFSWQITLTVTLQRYFRE